jgi:hypothetical protein
MRFGNSISITRCRNGISAQRYQMEFGHETNETNRSIWNDQFKKGNHYEKNTKFKPLFDKPCRWARLLLDIKLERKYPNTD